MVVSNFSMFCPDFRPVCMIASNLSYISFTILLILLSTLECQQLLSGKVSLNHEGANDFKLKHLLRRFFKNAIIFWVDLCFFLLESCKKV